MRTTTTRGEYTHTSPEEHYELTFEVSGSWCPGYRGDYFTPPEPATFEDVDFHLESIRVIRAGGKCDPPIPRARLKAETIARHEREMEARYHDDSDVADRVYDALRD